MLGLIQDDVPTKGWEFIYVDGAPPASFDDDTKKTYFDQFTYTTAAESVPCVVGDVLVIYNPHVLTSGQRWNYLVQQIRIARNVQIDAGLYYCVIHTGSTTQRCVMFCPEDVANHNQTYAEIYDSIADNYYTTLYMAIMPNDLMKPVVDPYEELL